MTDAPPGLEPLVVEPPSLCSSRAATIVEEEFGKRGTATELSSERDQNFHVETEDGEEFVLKISSPADDAAALGLQTQVLAHVHDTAADLPVMRTVYTTDGRPWTSVEANGVTYLVRLFTHLPGGSVTIQDLDTEALFEYGETVARLGEALRGFFHPDARYDILWDLRHTPTLRSLLDSVTTDRRRDLAERVLDRYDDRVDPVFETLRAQVIHNDLTLDNVLLNDDGHVSGIVDFGDLTHTALVCDLVMALASVMYRRNDPVEAAEEVVRGYVSVTPLEVEEARLLADLVAARLVTWGVIVAWRVEHHPEKTDHTVDGVDDGWALLEELDDIGLDAVQRRLQTAALGSVVPYPRMETDDVLARRRQVLGESPLSYDDPIHLVAGDGAWLFDPEGRRYLDGYNNVQVVGHAHPDVAAAIGGQARKLATNTRYLHESVVTLSERILDTMPDELDRIFFVNSGSEAVDLAWRLATAVTGHDGAVVTPHAYHGITDVSAALSPEIWPEEDRPDYVETVSPPVETSSHHASTGTAPTEEMADALDTLETNNFGVAAFVFDSMFTSDGILPPDSEVLGRMADRVRDAGGLVVADEVQAGFGRTGTAMWGFEAADIVPDIVTLGKPMGNGHPVAAVVTRSDIASTLMERTGMFSTFGGNPVSATAALAVLDAIEGDDLLSHTADVGAYLEAGLAELAATYDIVGEIRRQGLMVGVELVHDDETWAPAADETAAVVEKMRQRRVLIGSTGMHGNVLKIRPPLVFDHDHADHLLSALEASLAELE
ncbi:aminotransferase class III-fold pyridoxal phosphate-dependent enzyme [Haloferax sp. DFSO52]|uniref:aminotransferase class III-fold pyridoxal phosphate-dependent enzyme n=1 Tax=Haloferax sp. DFSO52 TaxID=3388505 RepID=UPI003A8717D5